MTRLFWAGLSHEFLSDGRTLLNVEFIERPSGKTYKWTPKWSHMFELTRQAYDVEVGNETASPYEPSLRAARDLYSEQHTEPIHQESPPDEELWTQCYCYECGWHLQGMCCDWCLFYPEQVHQWLSS